MPRMLQKLNEGTERDRGTYSSECRCSVHALFEIMLRFLEKSFCSKRKLLQMSFFLAF